MRSEPPAIPAPPGGDPMPPPNDREAFVVERTHADGKIEQVRVVRYEAFVRERARFGSWRRRATAAFVFLTVVSTLAAWLGYDAGRDANVGIQAEAQRTVYSSCIDRADLRIAVAVGFDKLRRLALPPNISHARQDEYLERTQEPINVLLTEAAERPVNTRGAIGESTLASVRENVERRCSARADEFNHADARG